METIKVKEIEKVLTTKNYLQVQLILNTLLKKQGSGTVKTLIDGLEFLLFERMANGRKNVYKIGGMYKGSYRTLEIVP